MKSSLSKVAVAVACFGGSITIDHAAHGVYFDDEGAFVKASAPLLRGIRWTTNRAYAASCEENSATQCERITVIGQRPPEPPPRSPFEPSDPRDGFDPDADQGNGGGGGNNNSNSSNDNSEVVIDNDAAKDVAVLVGQLRAELLKLKAEGRLSPASLARLNTLVDGLTKWASLLNSGAQLTAHLIESNHDAAFAEAAAFIAGYGAAAGIVGLAGLAAASGVVVPATAVAITAALGSYFAANATESFLNNVQVATSFNNYLTQRGFSSSPNQPPSPIGRDEPFFCRLIGNNGACRFIPPIILDLDGNGIEIAGLDKSNTYIDYDNDGYMEDASWVKGGDGILFIDKNNNGRLDDYYEFSLAHLAGENKTDLDGLKTLDTNHDGQFDQKDTVYKSAGIWIDGNHNAVFDEGETYMLTDFGVTSINFRETKESYSIDGSGVMSTFTYTLSSSQGSEIVNEAYDVMFLASADGWKVKLLDDGSRIVMYEISQNALDLGAERQSIDFDLGVSERGGMKDFGSLRTGSGDDTITISRDDTSLIEAGRGNDIVTGGSSDDKIQGQGGDDTLRGKRGKDSLFGGAGRDRLFGGRGDDFLRGGRGNDTLNGGRGDDLLIGGKGKDTFVISEGIDVVRGFDHGIDRIKANGLSASDIEKVLAEAEEFKRGIILRFSDNSILYLKNIDRSSINLSDFVF